jgi:hypothetical protein
MSDLQFDKAEFRDSAGQSCTRCSSPIRDQYWSINGRVVCNGCRLQLLAEGDRGVSGERVLTAVGLGVLGAVAGGAVYYGVIKLTGINLGLVALVVGFLVGGAVRHGAQRQGGPVYQAIAVTLTYLAIACMWGLFSPGDTLFSLEILRLPISHALERPLSGVITAFALYEAWKVNRRPPLLVSGPHQIAPKTHG